MFVATGDVVVRPPTTDVDMLSLHTSGCIGNQIIVVVDICCSPSPTLTGLSRSISAIFSRRFYKPEGAAAAMRRFQSARCNRLLCRRRFLRITRPVRDDAARPKTNKPRYRSNRYNVLDLVIVPDASTLYPFGVCRRKAVDAKK